MPLLYMQTEQVRAVAQQISALASEIQTRAQVLSQATNNLDSNWQGGGCDQLMSEVRPLCNRLGEITDSGNQLNIRLQKEVEEWMRVGAFLGQAAGTPATNRPILPDNVNFDGFPGISKEMDYLLNTESGRDLLEAAAEAGLYFEFEGEVIGECGQRIQIESKDLAGGKNGQYDPDYKLDSEINDLRQRKIFIDERYKDSESGLSQILAHEMQHALDDELGKYVTRAELAQQVGLNINSPDKLEEIIGEWATEFVHSEVRAYERGDAVANSRAFVDAFCVNIA